METVVFWAFTIYCTTKCNERSPMENKFMTTSSYARCIDKAKNLLQLVGADGAWEIKCSQHQRTITVRTEPTS